MPMKKVIVAIDGYSACGKSTTAQLVANLLGYTYIDSGAMYRAVTLYFLEHYITATNNHDVARALNAIHIDFRRLNDSHKQDTFLNGINVEEEIRTMAISERVSEVSAIPLVRHAMVALQQSLGRRKGIVMDGRDIGTVVFPAAELKVFMTADKKVRAQRRQNELLDKGVLVAFDEVLSNLEQRDYLDTTRKESPLVKADDAWVLDNTNLTIDEQVDLVARRAEELIFERKELADY